MLRTHIRYAKIDPESRRWNAMIDSYVTKAECYVTKSGMLIPKGSADSDCQPGGYDSFQTKLSEF